MFLVRYACHVPEYSIRDVIDNLRRHMAGGAVRRMTPWFRGFVGVVAAAPATKRHPGRRAVAYTVSGCATRVGRHVRITELPAGRWTADYRVFLDTLVPAVVESVREAHTHETVVFDVTLTAAVAAALTDAQMRVLFALDVRRGCSGLVLMDPAGRVTRYRDEVHVLEAFAVLRLECYGRRRHEALSRLAAELAALDTRARFLGVVSSGALALSGRPRAAVIADLRALKLVDAGGRDTAPTASASAAGTAAAAAAAATAAGAGTGAQGAFDAASSHQSPHPFFVPFADDGATYDALLALPLSALTAESIAALDADRARCAAELERARALSPVDMWLAELAELERALDAVEAAGASSFASSGGTPDSMSRPPPPPPPSQVRGSREAAPRLGGGGGGPSDDAHDTSTASDVSLVSV